MFLRNVDIILPSPPGVTIYKMSIDIFAAARTSSLIFKFFFLFVAGKFQIISHPVDHGRVCDCDTCKLFFFMILFSILS
jgi:hypothetical protein